MFYQNVFKTEARGEKCNCFRKLICRFFKINVAHCLLISIHQNILSMHAWLLMNSQLSVHEMLAF